MEATASEGGSRGLTIAFRVIAGLGGLLFVVPSLLFVVDSWTKEDLKVHVVHNLAAVPSFVMIAGGSMLLLAWRPRQVALLRLLLASAIAVVVGGLFGGVLFTSFLIAPVIVAVLIGLNPDRAEVFRVASPNLALLAVAVAGAVPAVIYAMDQGNIQGGIVTGDDHFKFMHYAGMAVMALTLLLGAVAASFTGRAVRTARWTVGLAGAVMSVVWLAYPNEVGSIDTMWAVALLVLSIVYLAVGEIASREAATAAA